MQWVQITLNQGLARADSIIVLLKKYLIWKAQE